MVPLEAIRLDRWIAAPPAEAYRAFTHATALRDWLCNDASAQASAGGSLYLRWNDGYLAVCPITHFDPPAALDFGWHSPQEPGPTQVRLRFTAEGEGVRVAVEHSGFNQGPEGEQSRSALARAWGESLENLHSFLLDGVDLRFAHRPRLGIFISELTSSELERLGAPVKQGVLLGGVAEGSGAQAAGLQKDDLLVSLNAVPLENFGSFARALQGLKAGDRPPVEYYRLGQKASVLLELSSFLVLTLPESAAALADTIRATNARVLGEIRTLAAPLSEEQAGRKPQPGEWSVKELIGHFVLTERDYQSWAADMLRDNVVSDFLQFRPNVDERIGALVQRIDSTAGLLDELALAQEETAALVAALPAHFTTWRKHLYRRLAQWSLEITPGHLDEEHKEQLLATIRAVTG